MLRRFDSHEKQAVAFLVGLPINLKNRLLSGLKISGSPSGTTLEPIGCGDGGVGEV